MNVYSTIHGRLFFFGVPLSFLKDCYYFCCLNFVMDFSLGNTDLIRDSGMRDFLILVCILDMLSTNCDLSWFWFSGVWKQLIFILLEFLNLEPLNNLLDFVLRMPWILAEVCYSSVDLVADGPLCCCYLLLMWTSILRI